ncbi:MAG: 30S ribosomal protein S6 [Clostridia bacterium]|jgi:small subunit ribosomal protein S6|nr:30S ribosomal protein S6 [Clostridia bacterium]
MAKEYEIMLVFSVKESEEAAQALLQKFKDLIEKHGTLGEVDEWGRRKLAYLINDEPEGYYAVVNYSAEPEFPAELERRLKITDGVLRFLNIAK